MTSRRPWLNEQRDQLRLLYAEALIAVGRLCKSRRESVKAIHFSHCALNEVPERKGIHRDLMAIYEEHGERDKALNQYDSLQRHLHQA